MLFTCCIKKAHMILESKRNGFISEVQEWYQQKEGKAVGRDEVVDAINNLYVIKAADFNSGNICLKEHVWGTVE